MDGESLPRTLSKTVRAVVDWLRDGTEVSTIARLSCQHVFESLCSESRPRPENWIERKGACVLCPTTADWGQTWRPFCGRTGGQVLCGGICCRSWAQTRTNVGNMALHGQPSKPKNLGNSSNAASFQRVALNPQDWGRWASLGSGCPKSGLTWPNLILAPTGAQVGASAEVESKSIRMNVRSKSKSRPKVPKRGSLAGLAARDMNGQIPQSDWYSLQLGGGMFARARSPNCTGLR